MRPDGSTVPLYDLRCDVCDEVTLDVLQTVSEPVTLCPCGGRLLRTWIGKPPSVIGDECDVTVRHGLCHADGTPQRFTSKAEMKQEAARRGLVNHVEHLGTKGGDKSKFTSRWI